MAWWEACRRDSCIRGSGVSRPFTFFKWPSASKQRLVFTIAHKFKSFWTEVIDAEKDLHSASLILTEAFSPLTIPARLQHNVPCQYGSFLRSLLTPLFGHYSHKACFAVHALSFWVSLISFHLFIYLFKGQCRLISISVHVLASRQIFNCNPLAKMIS